MSTFVNCRRRHTRFALGAEDRVEFGFPRPDDYQCTMRLRDISAGGLSFTLAHDLPGLDLGFQLNRATLHIAGRTINADLLVVHVTPDDTKGSTCGALLFPRNDREIRRLASLIEDLERDEE